MPEELLVMRHGKSDWNTDAPSDWHRPLAPRGRKAATRMAGWIDGAGARPDRILSSDALRAFQTAGRVREALKIEAGKVEFRREFYGCRVATWADAISASGARRLLICGHNPELDGLVEWLSADPLPRSANGKLMTTAAVAHFRLEGGKVEEGAGHLMALARPKEVLEEAQNHHLS